MISEAKINKTVEAVFKDIEFPSDPALLYDPIRYMLEAGGKRLRPRLALTTYSLYRSSFDESILQPAVGLEIYHQSTLVHDDIIDDSPIRRGAPTVWKKWGLKTGVLAGDAMVIDAVQRLCQAPEAVRDQVLATFTYMAAQVMEGQQYDIEFESRDEVSMEEYMEMIGLKTGALIACAAKTGALIGGAGEKDCDNFYEYGYNLGLAFQITDDYLDSYGDEKTFGKAIGGDIAGGKKTWLTVRAFSKADPARKEELLRAFAMPSGSPEERAAKIDAVLSVYNALNIEEDAKYEILRLNDKAMDFASCSCSGLRLEVLRRFCEKLVGRTR